jgi:hypothetical protein
MDAVQLPSASPKYQHNNNNTSSTVSVEHTCAQTLAPLALACEQYLANSAGVADEHEHQRLQKALERLRHWYSQHC